MLMDEILFESFKSQPLSKIALCSEDGSKKLSYDELVSAIDELSAVIDQRLFKCITASLDNDFPIVSIMISRNIGMVVGILAILRSGCAYVPVDPNFPSDRQTYIFSQSKTKLLITDSSTYAKAKLLGVELPTVILIESTSGLPIEKPTSLQNLNSRILHERSGQDLMYVLYTSGSTGRPKGVMVPHQGVVDQMQWFAKELAVGPHTVVLGLATFCFDISVLEIFLPLLYGGMLVIADSATQKDPYRLIDVMKDRGVTMFQATPTTYEMLLAVGWKGDKNIDFLVGGEAFRPSLLPIIDCSRSLRNLYGPTETTIWSSSYLISEPPVCHLGAFSVPIGFPMSNKQFLLADPNWSGIREELRLVEGEGEGELLIGGLGVTLGYLNAPELTRKLFLPNPFHEGAGNGLLYRTGDLIRRLPDGSYMFVRRLDDQVKVNGFRIELAEIEMVLCASPLVLQAAVVVRKGQLAAYVRLHDGDGDGDGLIGDRSIMHGSVERVDMISKIPKVNREILLKEISKSLTEYMIPSSITFLERFPMTATMKLDRSALPNPDLGDFLNLHCTETCFMDSDALASTPAGANNLPSRPHDSQNHTLADHICGVIEQCRGQRLRVTDNFASIGVDSLGAVLFTRVLSESLGGIRIYPSTIFAKGVTIQSFSNQLYTRLLVEAPDVLTSLKLTNGTVESSLEAGEAVASNMDGQPSVSQSDTQMENLDDLLLANKDLLEGIRGAIILLVFFEHFRGDYVQHYPSPYNTPNIIVRANVPMFVIISGFTSSIQLHSDLFEMNCNAGSPSTFIAFVQRHSRFIISRALGIFPLLWLVLILEIPRWEAFTSFRMQLLNMHISETKRRGCIVLYILAGQTYDEECIQVGGPNSHVQFANHLWNCFLLFAAFCILHWWIKYFIQCRRRCQVVSLSLQCENGTATPAPATVADKDQHPTHAASAHFCLIWFATMSALLTLVWIISLDPAHFPDNFFIMFIIGSLTYSALLRLYWAIRQAHWLSKSKPISLFRRFFPDMLCVGFLVMFSPVNPQPDRVFLNAVVPFMFSLLLLSLITQFGVTGIGNCISRAFFQSRVMKEIGYCCFPQYLLQQLLLNYYLRAIKLGGFYHSDEYWAEENGWFKTNFPQWFILIGFLITFAVSWCVQKFFQDTLVPMAAYRIMITVQNLNCRLFAGSA